jgi:hypothetical protein
MIKQKFSLSGVVLLIPVLASANGEDVLFTFGLSLVLALIYIVVLIFFKTPLITKILVLLIYLVSIVLVYQYIDDIPYNDNKVYINCIVGFLPSLVGVISLLMLNFFKKVKI